MTSVLWQASDGGSEVCVVERSGPGWRLGGTVLTHDDEQPIELRYAVTVDPAWVTTSVGVWVAIGGTDLRELPELGELWSGTTRPSEYRNCVDVDLSFTPATNTLPIRRLGLGVGDQAEIEVAWLVWPGLDVRPVRQTYTRIAERRYRYAQDEFEAEIVVDDHGLVLEYQGLWHAVAVA
ncbi:MAG: putative glycolipid-binding domain-containing protein [Nocardioides sp.]|nr:putative glycolipid-binding domain-containing protein [Nocardioides sp.]